MCLIEDALLCELLFELFEGSIGSAGALRHDVVDVYLVNSIALVDVHASADNDGHTVLRLELEPCGSRCEHHRFD